MTTYFRPNLHMKCSFCKENGHNVKSCQTLASVECGYCHELGHTTRHCGKLIAKKQRQRAVEKLKFLPDADGFTIAKKTKRAPIRKSKTIFKNLNSFSGLDDVTIPAPKKQIILRGQWKKPLTLKSQNTKEPIKIKHPSESTLLKRRKYILNLEEKEPKKKPLFERNNYIGKWADAADADDSDSDSDYGDW